MDIGTPIISGGSEYTGLIPLGQGWWLAVGGGSSYVVLVKED